MSNLIRVSALPEVEDPSLDDTALVVLAGGATGRVPLSAIPGITPMPTGSLVAYAGAAAPTGWLLCYGQAVSRTTYANLFTALSTTYGAGDASTTFNLPDLRGRAVAGKDNMGGSAASVLTAAGFGASAAALGAVGGAETHTLDLGQIPAHSHQLASTLSTGTAELPQVLGSDASGTSNVTTNEQGADEPHPNVQPTIILNYIIKY